MSWSPKRVSSSLDCLRPLLVTWPMRLLPSLRVTVTVGASTFRRDGPISLTPNAICAPSTPTWSPTQPHASVPVCEWRNAVQRHGLRRPATHAGRYRDDIAEPLRVRRSHLLVAISDNRGYLRVLGGEEPAILRELVDIVAERDPDVVEATTSTASICPISSLVSTPTRSARIWDAGGGRSMSDGPATAPSGEHRPFTPVHLYGRHVVDTYCRCSASTSRAGSSPRTDSRSARRPITSRRRIACS